MKIEPIGKFTHWDHWSFGIHAHCAAWTLVALFGTSYTFGISRSGNAVGLCAGPLMIGFAR